MQSPSLPFNLDLLNLADLDIRSLRPVKVLDIMDGFSKNFHPDGLFSTETFGMVGEEKRNRMFSYIDLNIQIFHPIIFKALYDLKSLYGDIMSSKAYAVFDTELKDFVKSDPVTGKTGFDFFVKHYKDIKFEDRPSPKREFNIKLVNKYITRSLIDKFVVMPAGMRDYTLDENSQPSEDEINGLYRKVLSLSGVIGTVDSKLNAEYFNNMRFQLQIACNEIFEYIKNLLEGKSKLVLGKWAGRKVFHSTRNVITSYVSKSTQLFGPKSVSTEQTVVGLYQFLRATLPLSIRNVRDGFMSKVFTGPNTPMILVDKKTLKKVTVTINGKEYDRWMTNEGLEKVFATYGQENLRHDYIEISGHYAGLIFKGKDNTYRFLQDIDELPERYSKEEVSPITLTELIMLSVYHGSEEIPCFATRYPITGYGSIYPSYVYLKSTVEADTRTLLDDNWEPTDFVCAEFPIHGNGFYNSFSPAVKQLGRLGADKKGYKKRVKSILILYPIVLLNSNV
jgi:hypothetical protein